MWAFLDKALVIPFWIMLLYLPCSILYAVWKAVIHPDKPKPTVWDTNGRRGFIERYDSRSGTGVIQDKSGVVYDFSVDGFHCFTDTLPSEGRFVIFLPSSDGKVRFRLDPARLDEVHISKRFTSHDGKVLCLACGRYMVPRPQYDHGSVVSSVCPFCLSEHKRPRFSR